MKIKFWRPNRLKVTSNGVIDADMTYQEYLIAVLAGQQQHHEWRQGQAYFNVLHVHRPDLADWVRGTHFDPFYNNGHLDAFLTFINDNWETENDLRISRRD